MKVQAAIAMFVLAAFACRVRTRSTVKDVADGSASEPSATLAGPTFCTPRPLVIFVGAADVPVAVVVGAFASALGPDALKVAREAEMLSAKAQHAAVLTRVAALPDKVMAAAKACATPPAGVTLVRVSDGPGVADAEILLDELAPRDGVWRSIKGSSLTFKAGVLGAKTASFELSMARDLAPLVRALAESIEGVTGSTLWVHGLVATTTDVELQSLSRQDLHAFAAGPGHGERLHLSDMDGVVDQPKSSAYVSPLWHRTTFCKGLSPDDFGACAIETQGTDPGAIDVQGVESDVTGTQGLDLDYFNLAGDEATGAPVDPVSYFLVRGWLWNRDGFRVAAWTDAQPTSEFVRVLGPTLSERALAAVANGFSAKLFVAGDAP